MGTAEEECWCFIGRAGLLHPPDCFVVFALWAFCLGFGEGFLLLLDDHDIGFEGLAFDVFRNFQRFVLLELELATSAHQNGFFLFLLCDHQ